MTLLTRTFRSVDGRIKVRVEIGRIIEHEPEGVFRIRESLKNDMEAEKTITIELRKSIKKALELEDFGTKSLLEGILLKTEDRAHHIEHFLGEDTVLSPKPSMVEV